MFSVGYNIRPPILAVLATYVDASKETAQVYTLMSILEALCHAIGSPVIESIWAGAVDMGGSWLVFPFLVLAVRIPIPTVAEY